MPTYEYGCEACGKKWEAEQRITEAPIKKCPKCGKLKAKRLISGGTFMLKGGGWYADGYGSSKKSSGSSDGDKSKSTKAETKSETKTESSSKSASGASDS
ncbi:MAG TPA: zinc ribbon domain-containing protein [Polyangiales bacterium]